MKGKTRYPPPTTSANTASGKNAPCPTGRTAEIVDLDPTLADLCGLNPDRRIQGNSLRPGLEQPDREWNRAAFT